MTLVAQSPKKFCVPVEVAVKEAADGSKKLSAVWFGLLLLKNVPVPIPADVANEAIERVVDDDKRVEMCAKHGLPEGLANEAVSLGAGEQFKEKLAKYTARDGHLHAKAAVSKPTKEAVSAKIPDDAQSPASVQSLSSAQSPASVQSPENGSDGRSLMGALADLFVGTATAPAKRPIFSKKRAAETAEHSSAPSPKVLHAAVKK